MLGLWFKRVSGLRFDTEGGTNDFLSERLEKRDCLLLVRDLLGTALVQRSMFKRQLMLTRNDDFRPTPPDIAVTNSDATPAP